MVQDAIKELMRRRQLARGAGRADALARQRDRGLLTPYERVEKLVDPGSFLSVGALAHSEEVKDLERTMGESAIAGFGTIEGAPVAVRASDPTVKGGSGGSSAWRRISNFHRIVNQAGLPLFELMQGGGARITDVISSRFAGYVGASMGGGQAFGRRHLTLVAVMGSYYAPWYVAESDIAVMTQDANASFTSPPLLEQAIGQKITPAELGGADIHSRITGQVELLADDDADAILKLRHAFSYFPATLGSGHAFRPAIEPQERNAAKMASIIPESPSRAYNMRAVLDGVFDDGSVLEILPRFARNVVAALARLNGRPVAVLANNPMNLAGAMDVAAIIKAKKLLSLCEDWGFPLITFIDTPGLFPTREEEQARLLSHTYELAVQRIRVSVPKIAVVLRKAYGYGYFAMSGGDPEGLTYAWPTAQIAFTGPEPAAAVVFRNELAAAPDPKALLKEKADEMRILAEPLAGARLGYIDDIIPPSATREKLTASLEFMSGRNTRENG